MSRYIDLSHTIEHGTITYKGLPAPIICDYLSREDSRKLYAEGTEFQIGRIDMVANTGTYVDCPFHRYADGKDLAAMALEKFVDIPAVLVDATKVKDGISIETVQQYNVKGRAVLLHTNWARHWGSDAYFENFPFLTAEAAQWLAENGVALVGIDSHNIDDTRGNSRPVHSTLLKNEIPIVEHLCNLHLLFGYKTFTFTAVPPKFKGVGTFPVRAFATVLK